MFLKFIDRNTSMRIQTVVGDNGDGETYEALFGDLDTDTSFFAVCEGLYSAAPGLPEGTGLKITFWLHENLYVFEGRVSELAPHIGKNTLLIEQMTPIAATSRRSDTRNEVRIPVNLYTLAQGEIGKAPYRIPERDPVFSAETFDISAGGFCLVSNVPLESDEQLFLAEFSLSSKFEFLLPVKLLRKGNCPQTVLYHFDYGFLFVFDAIPNEKGRISAAITDMMFRTRLAALTR
jgi:c-di-GMP-binding flagellar brake protein YcgR